MCIGAPQAAPAGHAGRAGPARSRRTAGAARGEHLSTERGRSRCPGVLAAGTAARLGTGCVALGCAWRWVLPLTPAPGAYGTCVFLGVPQAS